MLQNNYSRMEFLENAAFIIAFLQNMINKSNDIGELKVLRFMIETINEYLGYENEKITQTNIGCGY